MRGLAGAVEDEVKAIRRSVLALVTACMVLAIGFAFLLVGAGLLTWSLCTLLAPAIGMAGASAIAGGVALLVAALLIMGARHMAR
jgi:predicted phage tail protein